MPTGIGPYGVNPPEGAAQAMRRETAAHATARIAAEDANRAYNDMPERRAERAAAAAEAEARGQARARAAMAATPEAEAERRAAQDRMYTTAYRAALDQGLRPIDACARAIVASPEAAARLQDGYYSTIYSGVRKSRYDLQQEAREHWAGAPVVAGDEFQLKAALLAYLKPQYIRQGFSDAQATERVTGIIARYPIGKPAKYMGGSTRRSSLPRRRSSSSGRRHYTRRRGA